MRIGPLSDLFGNKKLAALAQLRHCGCCSLAGAFDRLELVRYHVHGTTSPPADRVAGRATRCGAAAAFVLETAMAYVKREVFYPQ
jgi:hypothetical protein